MRKLLLIMLLTIVWTASRAQDITMDFTNNSGWNIPGKDEITNNSQMFENGNNAITLSGGYYYANFKSGPYLFLNSNATLTFSKFDFDVERIVVIGKNTRTSQSIYVGENLVSDTVKGGLGPRTFWINEEYQNARNVYTLKVTGDNAHIAKIEIYKKGSFVPEGKAVFFVGGTDRGSTVTNITKDGVTISGKKIALKGNAFNDYGTYDFHEGANFTISVETGTITKIEFLGNKSLENLNCEGYSVVSEYKSEWKGNAQKVSFTSPNAPTVVSSITVYVSLPIISLSESEENTIETQSDINISLNRKLVKGVWNTICLPFDVTAGQAKTAFGEGVKIAQLNKASTDNTLSFTTVDAMKAAAPYLIMPTIAAPADGYKFEGVTIKDDGKGNVVPGESMTEGLYGFVGIYNPVDVTTNIESTVFKGYSYAAFLGANNTIFKAKAGGEMKGFRAYFAIPKNAVASALRVVIDGTATSIKNIDCEIVESNAPVYNLQGQRVDTRSLMPGLYIKAGKKFVVR